MLRAVTILGVVLSAGGALLLVAHGGIGTRNSAGVPRWLPHLISLVLASSSALAWRPTVLAGTCAAFYAAGAACFARPGLRLAGGPDIRLEPLVGLLAAAALCLAALPDLATSRRLALLAAPLLVLVASAAINVPAPAAGWSAAATYTLAALLSLHAAVTARRICP